MHIGSLMCTVLQPCYPSSSSLGVNSWEEGVARENGGYDREGCG